MHERVRKETPKPADPDYVKSCKPKSHLNWPRWVSWRSLVPRDERFWHVNGHLAMRSWAKERRKRNSNITHHVHLVGGVCLSVADKRALPLSCIVSISSRLYRVFSGSSSSTNRMPEPDLRRGLKMTMSRYVDKRCHVWVFRLESLPGNVPKLIKLNA